MINNIINTAFPMFVLNQTIARRFGEITNVSLTSSEIQEIAPNLLKYLSTQEKTCINLRLRILISILDKTPIRLTEDQQFIFKNIQNLSKGILSQQLNGFRLLLSHLYINSQIIDRYGKAVFSQESIPIRDFVEIINKNLIIIIFKIEEIFKCKGTISIDNFKNDLCHFQDFFNQIDKSAIKDLSTFTKQKNLFMLFERCLKDPDNLFPLLLIPYDQYATNCRQESYFLTVYFTKSKQDGLLGAMNLVRLACETNKTQCNNSFTEIKKIFKSLNSTKFF